MAYGAVARHGSSYPGSYLRTHTLRVCVVVSRNIGAADARQYIAQASACRKGAGPGRIRGRYGIASGRTPTAATKKALRAFASKVK